MFGWMRGVHAHSPRDTGRLTHLHATSQRDDASNTADLWGTSQNTEQNFGPKTSLNTIRPINTAADIQGSTVFTYVTLTVWNFTDTNFFLCFFFFLTEISQVEEEVTTAILLLVWFKIFVMLEATFTLRKVMYRSAFLLALSVFRIFMAHFLQLRIKKCWIFHFSKVSDGFGHRTMKCINRIFSMCM